ncbi:MAG: ABC transporter substrate-binding protein [Deltaproteobacteria bacterium]|nr:ABC transporter substrate-binding protein [Deltaproteobacteria bacterium]MCZ6622518.1 ABC transporter substrate-binding protein [Deltaproteobacteria bacterium]
MPKAKKKINVESAEAVLGLHWFVAKGEGLFAEEGLEVEILLPGVRATAFSKGDPRATDHHLVNSMNYQFLFEQKKVDITRACEWGQIRRAYDSKRGCPIVGKRPAVVCQGIYVRPDSPINSAYYLAGKTVGVQFHQGSHYLTLSMLEGFLTRDEMKVVHAGTVRERYEALMEGKVEAATLMEPWITLVEKNGCKKLVEGHYVGVENASYDLDSEAFQAMMRAIRKAVRLINADKRKYVHYMIEEMPEKYAKQLAPEDFYLPRLRYVDPEPYTQEEFEKAYKWMLSWDLVGSEGSYEKLVSNAV